MDEHASRRRLLGAAGWAVAALSGQAVGCLDRPLEPIEPRSTFTVIEQLRDDRIRRIDLLLVIDNSLSMTDKQKILQVAVPDLVERLVAPACRKLDDPNVVVQAEAADLCPDGYRRQFPPIQDIHIGIISSSIGGHGSDACPAQASTCGQVHGRNDDRAHLLAWKDEYGTEQADMNGSNRGSGHLGFLAWDPERVLGDEGIGSSAELGGALAEMVAGTGQIGCNYEATLESWYRFLVDPAPYARIERVPADGADWPKGYRVERSETDLELLQQRRDFLRPDSLVAILVLTDENDCSIRERDQYFIVAQQFKPGTTEPARMPRARSECALDPNDPCCTSCIAQTPEGCPADAACEQAPWLAEEEDPSDLRCFDQKRRFGIDFLYPIERYVNALTQERIDPSRPADDLAHDGDDPEAGVPNPLFTDLDPDDGITAVRTPDDGRIFLAGIVGVPWQDIARQDEGGKPDLLAGLDAQGRPVGGFKSAAELAPEGGASTWDVILGRPKEGVLPLDPLMIESVEPRLGAGVNPITGDAPAPPDAPVDANPMNGHERTTSGDLQYACIFPLPEQGGVRDCAMATSGCAAACDCASSDTDNPLCDPSPSGGLTVQARAKAFPGLRHLEVLKGLGPQGIVASVCSAQTTDKSRKDFGYAPAVGTIIDSLATKLKTVQCLHRTLTPDAEGKIPCLILEARTAVGLTKETACEGIARSNPYLEADPIEREHKVYAAEQILATPAAAALGWNAVCEITQIEAGAKAQACQQDPNDPPQADGERVDGWCYVDVTTAEPADQPAVDALVTEIAPGCERMIRFVGKAGPLPGSTMFINCGSAQ